MAIFMQYLKQFRAMLLKRFVQALVDLPEGMLRFFAFYNGSQICSEEAAFCKKVE